MIIVLERLLFIEESIDDLASRIINGEMTMYGLIIEPRVRRSVHLDEFAEISVAGPAGMVLGSVQQLKLVDCLFNDLFHSRATFQEKGNINERWDKSVSF